MENEVNILAQEKPKTVKLADGKEYTLPIIDLTTLANIEKTMGIGGKRLNEKMENEPLSVIQLFAYAILKENYPELTPKTAGHLITIKELPEFSQIISTIMAMS